MDSVVSRAREGRKLVLTGVAANVILAVAKVAGGVLGRSNALIADGIESSLDILSSGLMWGAMKYAERPPDTDHPYGHGKMESLAAVTGSIFLTLAGLSLGIHSVGEIIKLQANPGAADIPAAFTLVILGGTIVTKEGLFRWLRRRGEAIGSKAVLTDAWHHRSDAMTSLAAVFGITAALVGGPAWAQADDWAALFSCALILFNGIKMLRSSIGDILDEQASTDVVDEMLVVIRGVPGVTSVEKFRVRKSGFSRFADLHVRVAGSQTVREGHDIAHSVKDRLLTSDFHLADVTVHIEPEKDL